MKKEQITFSNGKVIENYKPDFTKKPDFIKKPSLKDKAIKAYYKATTQVPMLIYVMSGGTVEDYQKIKKAAELDETNSKTAND
jgi:hypothetical protein